MGVETDEFAGMLRTLKERSGHSYGVLATRLHTSTSTLHRYCNGAAVPAEYAPVERFARVCGASDAELVELHRHWILADAARRREAGPAAAPKPTPVPKPAPLPEAAPEAAPEPVPERASEPVLDVVRTVRSTDPEPGTGRRRSRALLGAVAVVGLAVAGSAFVLYGRGEPVTASPAAVTSSIAATTTPSTDATPTPPPAPVLPPATTPDPTATPDSTASPTPAQTPTPPLTTAAAAPVADTPAPFHVNVLTDNWGSPCGQWFLSSRSPGQVSAPPDAVAEVDSWAAAQQAVPGGHLRLQLTAQGADATPVVLHAAYVHVVSTQPVPKWNAYMPVSGCGGGLTPASFAVNLDASAPRLTPVPGRESTGKSVTSNFPYRVSATDPQVIDVDATTAAQDVTWYLDLVWSSGDRQGRLRVDDHGRPFRTAGIRDTAAFLHDGKRWIPTRPDF
ncbi:helix-turn-helix transcriptional regulator [Kitasatospora sp. NPDC093806]|uniref:helix-turn-helix transcriptional regulator n=1 Tax=Kitasatospora sp. NPDC093806 TaxID=3155075 RepID=UPI00342A6FC9